MADSSVDAARLLHPSMEDSSSVELPAAAPIATSTALSALRVARSTSGELAASSGDAAATAELARFERGE